MFLELKNRFQGIYSAILFSLVGQSQSRMSKPLSVRGEVK